MNYFVNEAGAYLGGWDQGGPESGVQVQSAPQDARQVWDFESEEWGVIPVSVKDYTDRIQLHLDRQAQAYGYDSIASAVTYAEEPAVPKFQAEGQAFRAWRSLVWAYSYEQLALVEAGEREQPTLEGFIAELPPIGLPVAGQE